MLIGHSQGGMRCADIADEAERLIDHDVVGLPASPKSAFSLASVSMMRSGFAWPCSRSSLRWTASQNWRMFLGRRYGADEALAMGLVHRVLPDAELERYVNDVIRTLCDNAPLAIANTKTILEEYVKSSGSPDAARMSAAIERCAKSSDYIEGRRAFMEKRKPQFKGA